MSSPFSAFRKYQKALIAIFGVGLMIAFLVEGSLFNILTGRTAGGGGGGRTSGHPVSFKGGTLTDEQLQRMFRADMLCDYFLRQVVDEAQKKKAQPHMFPEVENPQFGEPKSEARLVRNYLLHLKAHELGLSMSNVDIDDMIKNLADDALDKDEIKKIRQKLLADEAGSTILITERDIYAQLRINFLAQEVLAMVRNSTQPLQFERMGFVMPNSMTLPPAEAWELFRRTARQAEVELLPLEVEKFVDEVKTPPTKKQLDDLFEKYKESVALPFSPEPGFAKPHKIAFGYVRVDFQPFLDKAKSEVTEEAIRADYEQKLEKGELKVPVEKKKEEDADESKPEDNKPEDNKPEDKKPEDKKPEDKEPPEDKPAEPKAEEQNASEKAEDAEELAEDADQEPLSKEDQAEEPAEPKPDDKKPDDKKPDDKKPDDEATPDKEKKPDDENKPADKKPETRIKTYEEMEETIRTQLAQKPAQDAQRAAVDEVFRAVEEYQTKFREWEVEKEAAAKDKAKAKLPTAPQPDFLPVISGVLKKYKFDYKQAPLQDAFQIADEEIGKASVGLPNQQQIPVSDVYQYDIKLYQAFPASEGFLRDTTYILWKESDQPQQPAERKDVDDQLVRAVKLQEAFKLAKAEADRLASDARKQPEESLRKSLGAVEKAAAVVEPQPFSWLSSGFVPGGMGMRLQPTEIPEVPYAGEEFMQAVLDLQPGEVGVAADQPHKRIYVIRVISQTPEEEILREMFLSKGVSDRNVSQQYNSERMALLTSWMSNVFEKEMQLKWNRQPQQYER